MMLNMKVYKIRICLTKNCEYLRVIRDQAVWSVCSFQGWKGIGSYQVGVGCVKCAAVVN